MVKDFTFSQSDLITLDAYFSNANISVYLYVSTAAGDIVYEDQAGNAQWIQNAALGYHPIKCRRVLTNGTVNGNLRTTSATGIIACLQSNP